MRIYPQLFEFVVLTRNQVIYSRGNEYHITGFPRAVPLEGDSVTAVIGLVRTLQLWSLRKDF